MNTIKLNAEKKPLMVAHRGVSGLETENTNAAFVAAGNRSYYGIETDVHKTADGQFIIIHDDKTGRVAGGDDMVVEMTSFDTLRSLTLVNKISGKKDRADLMCPSLAEYIGICKKYEKYAVLELKNAFEKDDIGKIVDIIREEDYLEHVIFISFCYDNLVFLHTEFNQAACLRGEDRHTAQGSHQLLAVYGQLVRVILRNYRVVVRVTSFNQTTNHPVAFEHEYSVAFVKFDGHCALFFRQKIL